MSSCELVDRNNISVSLSGYSFQSGFNKILSIVIPNFDSGIAKVDANCYMLNMYMRPDQTYLMLSFMILSLQSFEERPSLYVFNILL